MKLRHGTAGLAVGNQPPCVQIELRDPVSDRDNGVTLYFTDAPVDEDPTIEDCRTICIHCILKSHRTIGKGLRVAQETGLAVFVDGAWQPAKRPGAEAS